MPIKKGEIMPDQKLATIKDSVIITVVQNDLPLDLAVYFIAMIRLAGGDTSRTVERAEDFQAAIETAAAEINREFSDPKEIQYYNKLDFNKFTRKKGGH